MNQRPVFSPGFMNPGVGCCPMRNMPHRGNNRIPDLQERLRREGLLDRRESLPTTGCNRNGQACRMQEQRSTSGCGCSCGQKKHRHTHHDSPANLSLAQNEGCGCGCASDGEQNGDCSKLLKQLRTVDFALYEVILYLDAYPDHCDALELYHKLLHRRHELIAAYEAACGPMTAFGNISQTSWDWVKTPAPWEYSQN